MRITTVTGTMIPVENAPVDRRNKFFDPALGNTGQSCSTCHQPDQGWTIHVDFIRERFAATGGTDPLFHFSVTANNPDKGEPTADNYSVLLNMGATRIAKPFLANSNFTPEAADQATIDKFGTPRTNGNDPELALFPGGPSLKNISAFRRPIVMTNLHLETSVLSDGASTSRTFGDR